MAALVRALQPHDVLAYLAFAKRANRQDGVVTLGSPPSANVIRDLAAHTLLLDPSRQRWICRDGGQIVASLAVRTRPGVDIWEVDECSGLPTPAGRLGRLRLLNRLGEEAVEEGIQKIFMRVQESGTLEELARQAGFGHYAAEHVYWRPAGAPTAPAPAGMRSRRGVDHHALFQLYASVVPGRVRQVEAMTLQEWRLLDGWRREGPRWAPGMDFVRRDVVVERGGTILAWLQLNRRRSLIRYLASPDYRDELPRLVAWGIGALRAPKGYLCTIRDYQLDTEPALLDLGFRLESHHALLARLLAARIPEPKLVPVRV